MRKYILVLIALVFSSCMTMSVLASETVDPSVELDIEIVNEISGDTPQEESFVFQIKAVESGYPLPEVTELTITGDGEATFEDIVFTTVGTYEYEICQLCGECEDYTYDETVYEIVVYVSEDNSGKLETTVYAIREDTQLKSASIAFVNEYASTVSDTPESESGLLAENMLETGDSLETGDASDIEYLIFLMILSLSVIGMLVKRYSISEYE